MDLAKLENFMNISDYTLPVSTSWVPAGLEFIFGAFGNFIALLLLIRSRKEHHWSPFYILYCGLAVTDFSGIAFVYPFVMKRYASDFEWSIKSVPGLCDYMSLMWMWGLLSTGLLICTMSINRFHTIFFTDVYNSNNNTSDTRTKRKYTGILLSIWVFSGIIAMMPITHELGHNDTFYPGSWCFLAFAVRKIEDDLALRIYCYIYSLLGIAIFAVAALANIVTISALLLHRSRGGMLFQAHQVAGSGDFSILVFLFTVFLVFSTLWTPLMVNILQHATRTVKGNSKTELLVLRLSIANSIVDPWIYIMTQREVLMRIRGICAICRRNKPRNNVKQESTRLLDSTV
ncbi:hypothetical protein FSP39_015531 [Pinctada imbricata]|uniref:Thromboxane A2 receptor n=1 Tax=Pinctada imbricata TaxID=66713 RepID=A0AA89BPW6_PINIB|nr:hypothetical protein FSP39_015531 [Pinctada imbricata]